MSCHEQSGGPPEHGLLPSFFVIGPPRTGTSWLHEVLSRRMQLPTAIKETRFFDVHYHRGWKWYRAHYPKVSRHRLAGEIAPTYFASAAARERIAQQLPTAKVVCIFRDPVERIESLYRAKCAYGAIRGSLEDALLGDPELLESGRYAAHLDAWQNALGHNHVLPLIYDDLCQCPQQFLDILADFIGLERFVLAPSEICRVRPSASMTFPRSPRRTRILIRIANWCRRQRLQRLVTLVRDSPLKRLCLNGGPAFIPTTAATKARVYEHLRPEIERLEVLLDRDFTPWKGISPAVPAPSVETQPDTILASDEQCACVAHTEEGCA